MMKAAVVIIAAISFCTLFALTSADGVACDVLCWSPFTSCWGVVCWTFCGCDRNSGQSKPQPTPPSCLNNRHKRLVSCNFSCRHIMVHPGTPTRQAIQNFLTTVWHDDPAAFRHNTQHTIILANDGPNMVAQINNRLPLNDNTNAGWVVDSSGNPVARQGMWYQDQLFGRVIIATVATSGTGVILRRYDPPATATVRLGICLRNPSATRPSQRYSIMHLGAF